MVSKKMNVITKPMVVRLKGIHEREARKHLEEFMTENREMSEKSLFIVDEMDMAAL